MEYTTIGHKFYIGYRMNLSYTEEKVLQCDLKDSDSFKLILITSGSGVVNINGRHLVFTSPAIFCLNENENPYLVKGNNVKTLCMFFNPNIINCIYNYKNIRDNSINGIDSYDTAWLSPYINRTHSNHGYMVLSLDTLIRIKNLFDIVNRELEEQRDEGWPCRSRSYFLELILIVERTFSYSRKETVILPDDTHNSIEDIIIYIFTNYHKKIELLELSRIFNINRTTLNQMFQKLTGFSVMTFLIRHRIQVAELMLRDTMLSVSEVSERVGFNDMTHFIRTFRKYTGETPTCYRKNKCWMISLYA